MGRKAPEANMVQVGSVDCPVEWNVERMWGEDEKQSSGGSEDGVEEERGWGRGGGFEVRWRRIAKA